MRSALIVPEGYNPEKHLDLDKHWVGRILEVRARNKDPSEVRYYTKYEVLPVLTLPTQRFGCAFNGFGLPLKSNL